MANETQRPKMRCNFHCFTREMKHMKHVSAVGLFFSQWISGFGEARGFRSRWAQQFGMVSSNQNPGHFV